MRCKGLLLYSVAVVINKSLLTETSLCSLKQVFVH